MTKTNVNGQQATSPLKAETFVIACPQCHTSMSTAVCAKCGAALPLGAILAQPYIEAELKQQSQALQRREQELASRLKSLDTIEENLNARAAEIDAAVEHKLRKEREALTKIVEKKAADSYTGKLRAATQELEETQAKLVKAEQAELAIRKERRAIEEEKRKLELEVERRIHDERIKIREAAQKEEQDTHRLKLSEKDLLISDLRKQIDDLRRKVDQGSIQLQGEVQELELEAVLRAAFPGDQIEPVPQGRAGGDVVHKVVGPNGLQCGTILWESKRTRNWNDDWLAKNREDQRLVGGHVGVIVTVALPKGVDNFDRLDGVWVAGMRCVLPLAKALRLSLVEMALIKSAAQGRDGKMQRMYGYLTGIHFRMRVSSMVETCMGMQEDLDAEKRALTRKWAKQQRRIEVLMAELASTWGDLQGIVGKGMAELDGLNMALLEDAVGLEPGNETNSTGTEGGD
jgi:hypothetical protein